MASSSVPDDCSSVEAERRAVAVVRPSLLARVIGIGRGERLEVGAEHVLVRSPRGFAYVRLAAPLTVERQSGKLWDRLRISESGSAEPLELQGLRRRDAERLEWFLSLPNKLAPLMAANAQFERTAARDAYLNRRAHERWRAASVELDREVDLEHYADVRSWIPESWRDGLRIFRTRLTHGASLVAERNEVYASELLTRYKAFFDRLESNPLTRRQREAIVHDEDNSLVVAGAGTGKTSTVVGKVGFLLKHDGIDPSRILLLAFGRRAKMEMQERVAKRIGVKVEVRTFHSLGMEIIRQAEGRRPALSPLAEDPVARERAITRYLGELLDDPEKAGAVVTFLAFHRYPEEPAEAFETLGEYYEHIRSHGPRSLKGELVKSWEELFIANWLCLQGVSYKYEQPYPHPTGSLEYRQYQPDFYLPDTDVYLEHFGIASDGSTAPYVDRVKYHQGIAWKRRLHQEHGTTLVETYSFDSMKGDLAKVLRKRLGAAGVKFAPLSPERIKELLTGDEHSPVAPLLAGFLSLFKGNGWTLAELRQRAKERANSLRTVAFLDVFEGIYEKYEAELQNAQQIDFDDMIRLAASHVEGGRYASTFTRIVVDEFQDISRGRCRLLQALLAQQTDGRLFCVGDDWQSIFRFTGSDVSIMTRFADKFGFTRRTDLDRTFRFNEPLLAFSSRFVTQNPAQLTKELVAQVKTPHPGVELVDGGNEDGLLRALHLIDAGEDGSTTPPTVMILGRYRHSCPPDDLEGLVRQFGRLKLTFRTVHASKGLEADYVIVLDLTAGRFGFPTGIADDPVLSLLLGDESGFPHAEERRLLYVAVTRARRRAYLVTDADKMSPFVREIRAPAYAGLLAGELAAATPLECPACAAGLVRRIEGPYGPFWGCSLFPYCNSRLRSCDACGTGPLIPRDAEYVCANGLCEARSPQCPKCGAVLTIRSSIYGRFFGCTNYRPEGPSCGYKHSVL